MVVVLSLLVGLCLSMYLLCCPWLSTSFKVLVTLIFFPIFVSRNKSKHPKLQKSKSSHQKLRKKMKLRIKLNLLVRKMNLIMMMTMKQYQMKKATMKNINLRKRKRKRRKRKRNQRSCRWYWLRVHPNKTYARKLINLLNIHLKLLPLATPPFVLLCEWCMF